MTARVRAFVECLDAQAEKVVSELRLPRYHGRLKWTICQSRRPELPVGASIAFVVASTARTAVVARHVARHREAGRFAIGIRVGARRRLRAEHSGIVCLKPSTWHRDAQKLLSFISALLCEGQPEVVVCIDWGDVVDALELPGEIIFEWSSGENANAVRTVTSLLGTRLSGRKCKSLVCLVGGGPHLWFKALGEVRNIGRKFLETDAPVLTGDSISPFRGKPGCCLLAVANTA